MELFFRLKVPPTPTSKTPTLDKLLKYNDDFGGKPTMGARHLASSGYVYMLSEAKTRKHMLVDSRVSSEHPTDSLKVERVSATPSRSAHLQPFSWQIPGGCRTQ
jgi:hypothetical protein